MPDMPPSTAWQESFTPNLEMITSPNPSLARRGTVLPLTKGELEGVKDFLSFPS